MQKIATGINGLDAILYGGIPEGSAIVIEGAPGTGKTTLGVQFLYNGILQYQEPGIYITFEEFPQQIYQDMLAFGWDLKRLEKENTLRVVSISPSMLLKQMKEPNGLFEQLIQEINCKRIVIDSISLYKYLSEDEGSSRDIYYNLRNILRKYALTTLLLSEQTYQLGESIPFEHYVFDGVMRLSLCSHLNNYRKRTLEILKMRGSKIVEGEHIYRITQHGIHLIPALSMVEDLVLSETPHITTGIKSLDDLLDGGITRGSVFLLDTNSKANYKNILGSIVSQRIKANNKMIALLSSINNPMQFIHLLERFDVERTELLANKKINFIEHYKRTIDPDLENVIIDVSGLSNEDYRSKLRESLAPLFAHSVNHDQQWFVYYDLNTIFAERGAEFVKRYFAEEAAQARSLGISILALINFTEIGLETASFLERTANGVIRTWVDGNYQYLQLTKSPTGRISEPKLVETISEKPFVHLI